MNLNNGIVLDKKSMFYVTLNDMQLLMHYFETPAF